MKRVLACLLLLLLAGCTAKLQSKEELVASLREHCTRDQSRINPKPVLQSKLMRIAGLPHEVVQVDDVTQQWTYRFPNGDSPIYVMIETGYSWQDEDPMVFVDLKRLPAN